MVQEVAIKLNFDAGQSINEVEKIDKVLKDIKKNTNVDNVNEQFQKLNATIEQGGNSAEDLQRAIKSYQTIALTAGRTSPIGQEAIKRSAMLKDQLIDLDNEVKRLANDHQKLQGAMQISTSVIGGYSAFQGVTALLGEENEELMQTMVKLQGAQSALVGIMEIKQALEKESNAMLLLQNIRTKALAGATALYNLAVGSSTKMLKLFRVALISTGLGALVVLIGVLIAKWNEWSDAIYRFVIESLGPMGDALKFLGVIEDENARIFREASEARIAQYQQQGEEIQKQQDLLTARYDHEIRLLRASGKETVEVERQKLKAIQESTIKQIKLLQARRALDEEVTQEMVDNAKDLLETLTKANNDLEVLEVKHQKKIQDEKKKSYTKQNQLREKFNEKEQELIERFQDLVVANIEDEAQRTLMALDLKHEREMQQLIEQYGEKTELIKKLERIQEQERQSTISEIEANQKAIDDQKEEDRLAKKKQRQQEIAQNEFTFAKMIGSISGELTENTIKQDEALAQAKQSLYNATKSAVGGLVNLLGQESDAGKAFALTQLAVDTALGFANGLRIAQQGAIATGPSAPFAFPIFYATQIGSVLQAIGKAKSILGAGSNVTAPSIGGSGGGGSRDASNGQLQGTQNTGRTDFVDNDSFKVPVVESDVYAIRQRQNEIDNISTI